MIIFSEINAIKRNEEKEVNIPMTKYINWYIFAVVNYFLLGGFLHDRMPLLGVWYPLIANILHYHKFICFSLLVMGFLGFVLSLKQGYLKYQFRLFGWIVVAALLVCFQAWSLTDNIFEGMIWFIIPCMLIVINDIFAYIFGYFFGKHQLIALSPKKTWEGYIGGAISTLLFSIIVTHISYLAVRIPAKHRGNHLPHAGTLHHPLQIPLLPLHCPKHLRPRFHHHH